MPSKRLQLNWHRSLTPRANWIFHYWGNMYWGKWLMIIYWLLKMNVISGEKESITNSMENITVLENHMKQIWQCAKEEQYKQKKLKYLHSTNAEINLWRLKVLLVHQKYKWKIQIQSIFCATEWGPWGVQLEIFRPL